MGSAAMPGHYKLNRRNPECVAATLILVQFDDIEGLTGRYGDDAGENALRALENAVRRNIRKNDIIIDNGNGRFVIVLANADAERTNECVLKRLQFVLGSHLDVKIGRERATLRVRSEIFPYDQGRTLVENVRLASFLPIFIVEFPCRNA